MSNAPELILGYEPDGFPRSAACTGCGMPMPDPPPGPMTPSQCHSWYKAQFERHRNACNLPAKRALAKLSVISLVA